MIADKFHTYLLAAKSTELRSDWNEDEAESENIEEAILKVRPSVTKDIDDAYKKLEGLFRQAQGKRKIF